MKECLKIGDKILIKCSTALQSGGGAFAFFRNWRNNRYLCRRKMADT